MVTTPAIPALSLGATHRALPSQQWHGDPSYLAPLVYAPRTEYGAAPALYVAVLAHPGPDVSVIRLPMQRGTGLSEQHNGLTMETLIGCAIDRIECFQRGDFRCDENAVAVHHLRHALSALALRRHRVDALAP